ncbi:MAG: RHS repeat-associated core domain-containing protein [Paracoccaceae bacterium]
MGRQAIRTLTTGPVTIHSVFDSQGRRIAEYNETSGALIREYVWNGWEPVALIEAGVVYFVRADHIGRPVFATNASGVKVWSASYLPFGELQVATGALPDNRFPGQWYQSESGLHQNWMRDYDPTTGRYLQADPLGFVDGASVYGYVRQNPGRWVDPRGEDPVPESVPDFIPGGPYGPKPGARPGTFLGPKQSNGPRTECQWVPEGRDAPEPYWKTKKPGDKDWQRYNLEGEPITAEQAHPGNPPSDEPCGCDFPTWPRLFVPRVPLFMLSPDLYDLPFGGPVRPSRA